MITKEQYLEALTTIIEYGKQLNTSVSICSYKDVITESLLSDAGFYAQLSLKANNDDEERKYLELCDKYYQAIEWVEWVENMSIPVDDFTIK
jgi:hypothetical protein